MSSALKTTIEDGQPYYDKPVIAAPKILNKPLDMAVSAALNGGKAKIPPRITLGHQRVRLRWMKPDGKGRLVPR